MRLACAVGVVAFAAASGAGAAGIRPTDIVAVDEFIDAPRAVFGRTRAAVQRTLGAPAGVEVRAMSGARIDRIEQVVELTYPGVVVVVAGESAALWRVEVTQARWALPRGLNVGAPRSRVEEALGEPQLATDVSALYLYSDAYPDTVEFFFRSGRVQRIEWLYAPAR